MSENIIPLPSDEMTDFERSLVERAVGVNIALRFSTRVEIREAIGIWARAFQAAEIATHDIKDERKMRFRIACILKDAQADALVYRRKAKDRERRWNGEQIKRREEKI